MKTIELFNEMKPENPEYTDGNHMFSMQGVDPLYYLNSGVQEKQASPLVATVAPTQASLWSVAIYGTIIQIIPAMVTPRTTGIDAYVLTDGLYVFGVNKTTNILLGNLKSLFLELVGTDGTIARMSIGYNGQLDVVAFSGNVYTLATNGASYPDIIGGWTRRTPGDYFAGSGLKQIESFQNYMIVTNPIAGGNTMSKVQLYPYTNNFTGGNAGAITLGEGWQIMRAVNYKNKYIAMGAYYSSNQFPAGGNGTLASSNFSYIFFWNGSLTNTTRYQFSVPVNGTLVDMCMSNNTLYVISMDRQGNYALYHYSGGEELKKDFNIMFSPSLVAGGCLFPYPGGVGINLLNKGAYIYTSNNGKPYKYIITNYRTTSTYLFCIATSGTFYIIDSDGVTTSVSYLNASTTSYQPIDATTQWIPVNTKLSSVNVFYDTKPTNVGDYIRVTATAWSEDQQDGVYTQQLSDITSTNNDTGIKTTLDLKGLTGTKLLLRIQTNSTGTWRPSIRGVELNENI